MTEVVSVFGLRIHDTTLRAAAQDVVARAAEGTRSSVLFANAHCINVAARDPAYAMVLRKADLLYADGTGMRWAASLSGHRLQDNVNGTDLFPVLCAEAARRGVPMALIGAKPRVAERCASLMIAQHPGLRIVFHHHGYIEPSRAPAVIDALNGSGARLLLVAMGVPQQELWLDRHAEAIEAPVKMGVGALFDFYSGDVSRAPAGMRALGFEWLYRLWREPRRMFGRYVLGNPIFVARMLALRVGGQQHLRESLRVRGD